MARPETAAEVRTQKPLSLQQARNLHLAAQGLLSPPRARATRARVLAAIERMRLLQIDTIHVVARSPYLVLFSRLGEYEPRWLDELLARGRIFECWAHEACFAPIDDYALHTARRIDRAGHWAHKRADRMHREHRAGMDRLLAHIREHGSVKSAHFERADTAAGGGGWWGWKDEKRWLEALFALGELMIARRENFQRVYDLSERVLAHAGIDPAALPRVDAARACTLDAVRALGVTQARWIADYFRTGRKHKDAELDALVAEGALLRVPVRGWEVPAYVHPDHAPLLERARRNALRASHATLLSPFDPVVWDRARASVMFDFDYTIECYTPAPKRRYGYFVLPILVGGRLVGRLDAKAHRAEGRFEVKALFLEPEVEPSPALAAEIAGAIQRCADWHRTPRVTIRRSDPASFAKTLRAALGSG
ncbi:MAG TPA: crosslink repair DNA glycosylase YcaQ family protein [Rudaea sp.]|nr:crosslink repair DNA glycosylase YcaQ family protein [Rudaea sp.]